MGQVSRVISGTFGHDLRLTYCTDNAVFEDVLDEHERIAERARAAQIRTGETVGGLLDTNGKSVGIWRRIG